MPWWSLATPFTLHISATLSLLISTFYLPPATSRFDTESENVHSIRINICLILMQFLFCWCGPRLAYCSKCLSWQWYWCSCTQQVAIVMQCTSNKELVYSELICEKWYRRKCLWLFIETYILLCKRSFVFCWTGLQLMLRWKAFSIFKLCHVILTT